ncbi:SPOR domain-containing protein [Roseateles violae]|uniref:SPOR domain-containing protein n=1 Tax=Roseateles violae TaxID=3058042 RepID=A0ABT8DL95_9BURK|nr:SPOR domain-containing protein [Pelomonas sp. PFR6]MDN3918877.1 SPOR domain-containing protein [Pelomonas sp. PFR6]
MSQARSSSSNQGNKKQQQRGGFVLGLIVGLLVGLAVALGVALYITKVPVPFINKVPQRTAEQDAEEAARNKNWDPNAPLASKPSAKIASGVVGAAPAAAPAASAPETRPTAPTAPVADASRKPDARAAAASALLSGGSDPYQYFVQAGAFTRAEDAEQQRAKLAMQGFSAKVLEREQSGRAVFRVRLGPLDSRDEAEGLQRKVEAAGIETNLVRVQR